MKKTLVCAAMAAAGAAHAQDLPKTQLKVVGGLSNLTAYNDYEKPFWTKTIPELSKGQVTADIKGFNEMGLKGPELLRLMSQGVIEFGTATLSYFASDNPINEAIDLAGLAPDAQTARAVTNAFEPVYARLYGEGNNVKLLGISTYPAQVLFCNAEIKGLADLKGKKVRTSSRTTAEFVEALGGSSVTMAFGEVVPALQNKVVDCAITGSLSGYSAKWYEVSTHLYALPINWNQQIHAVNQKAWDKLDPAVRGFLQANVKTLVDNIWDAAARQTQEGYDCNTGAAACPYPVKGKMVLVQPSEADRALLKKVTQEAVLPVGRALLGPVRQGLQRHRRQDAGRDRQQVMSRLRCPASDVANDVEHVTGTARRRPSRAGGAGSRRFHRRSAPGDPAESRPMTSTEHFRLLGGCCAAPKAARAWPSGRAGADHRQRPAHFLRRAGPQVPGLHDRRRRRTVELRLRHQHVLGAGLRHAAARQRARGRALPIPAGAAVGRAGLAVAGGAGRLHGVPDLLRL